LLAACSSVACFTMAALPPFNVAISSEIFPFAASIARFPASCVCSFSSKIAFCLVIFAAFSSCACATRFARLLASALIVFIVASASLSIMATAGSSGKPSAPVSAGGGTDGKLLSPAEAGGFCDKDMVEWLD